MHKHIAAIAAFFVAGSTFPVSAATSNGDFAVYGWGARNCETITEILQGEQAIAASHQLAEWASGYVTAYNRLSEDVYDVTPVKNYRSLVALSGSICSNNPGVLYENVVSAMLERFSGLQLPSNGPIIELENEGQTISVNESVVLRIQEFLIAEGVLQQRSADGQYGPRTQEALTEWQETQEIPATGLPDVLTLFTIASELE